MAKKNSFNINDLSSWSLPIALLFATVIVAGLFVFIKSFFVDKVTTEIESIESEIYRQQNVYDKNKQTVAILPHIKKEIEALRTVRDKAKKYLPTEVSMPSLLNSVYVSARDNGFVFDTQRPGKDIDTQFYTIKPMSLSADVGYVSMSAFIEEVTTLKRIMNVHSVSFKSSNKVNSIDAKSANMPLKMTAELRTYVFKESANELKKKK